MAKKPETGSLFGVPYNFERPSLRRLLSSYWQPGEGMLVEKPFGVGYTLNLANWRSWVVVAVAGLLFWQDRDDDGDGGGRTAGSDDEPAEILIED